MTWWISRQKIKFTKYMNNTLNKLYLSHAWNIVSYSDILCMLLSQICRWHHSYGRKWRGTKQPLDESESGEWKSWLKVQHSENEDHGIWSHHFMGNRWGNWKQCQTLLFWAPKSLQMVTAAMKLKDAYSLEGKLWPT